MNTFAITATTARGFTITLEALPFQETINGIAALNALGPHIIDVRTNDVRKSAESVAKKHVDDMELPITDAICEDVCEDKLTHDAICEDNDAELPVTNSIRGNSDELLMTQFPRKHCKVEIFHNAYVRESRIIHINNVDALVAKRMRPHNLERAYNDFTDFPDHLEEVADPQRYRAVKYRFPTITYLGETLRIHPAHITRTITGIRLEYDRKEYVNLLVTNKLIPPTTRCTVKIYWPPSYDKHVDSFHCHIDEINKKLDKSGCRKILANSNDEYYEIYKAGVSKCDEFRSQYNNIKYVYPTVKYLGKTMRLHPDYIVDTLNNMYKDAADEQ